MNISNIVFTRSFIFLTALFLASCGGDDNDNEAGMVGVVTEEPMVETTTIVDAAVGDGNFTTLVAALQATGLDAVLADTNETFTVFAPTDAAFALLGQDTIDSLLADTDTLSDILLYHVIGGAAVDSTAAIASAGSTVDVANGDKIALSLDGSSLLVNFSTVTTADIVTDNGVIHVIDAVLIPPTESEEPIYNIVETAVAAGSFSTLVTALQAAGLDSTLADAGETFTVFAPTDDAFALIDEADLSALIADTDALTDVLLQHVISGAAVDSVTALSLNGSVAATIGGNISIAIVDGQLQVGGANVVTFDIATTNGVIHVIDRVILETVE